MMLQLRAVADSRGNRYAEPLVGYIDHEEIVGIMPARLRGDTTVYSVVTLLGPTRHGVPSREQYGPFVESCTDIWKMQTLANGVPVEGWTLDDEGRLAPSSLNDDLMASVSKVREL